MQFRKLRIFMARIGGRPVIQKKTRKRSAKKQFKKNNGQRDGLRSSLKDGEEYEKTLNEASQSRDVGMFTEE